MEKKTILKVNNLYKIFWVFRRDFHRLIWIFTKRKVDKEIRVLNGIDFEIKHGEVVGIIGKNGAGKSTLLKIISGIYFPTMGDVTIDGKIASLIELGAGFEMDMTGRQNIYVKGQLMGMSEKEIDDIIDDIIRFADIGEYIDMPFKTYSSGMGARLGFALAVNVDPDILIIDEVFSVGDANFAEKSRRKTEEFFNAGKTILLVSHAETQIQKFCSRVIYLKDGKVFFDGDVDEGMNLFLNDQLNPYGDSAIRKKIAEDLKTSRKQIEKATKKALEQKTNSYELKNNCLSMSEETVMYKGEESVVLNFNFYKFNTSTQQNENIEIPPHFKIRIGDPTKGTRYTDRSELKSVNNFNLYLPIKDIEEFVQIIDLCPGDENINTTTNWSYGWSNAKTCSCKTQDGRVIILDTTQNRAFVRWITKED